MYQKKLVLIALAGLLIGFWSPASAHEGCDKIKATVPQVGPHGGKISKLRIHFAELVVSGSRMTVYVLERNCKNMVVDASKMSVAMEIPDKAKTALKLSPKDGGYSATIKLPKNVRRVNFHVSCIIDGKRETGKFLYEVKR